MKRVAGLICYQWDRIVVRWHDPKTGEVFAQAKRVSGKCPLSADERRAYVHGGMPSAIKLIMHNRSMGLAKAKSLLDHATKGRW